MPREQSNGNGNGNGNGKVIGFYNLSESVPEGFEHGKRYGLTFDALPSNLVEGAKIEVLANGSLYELVVGGTINSETYVDVSKGNTVVKFKDTQASGKVAPSSALRLPSNCVPRENLSRPFVAKVTSAQDNPRYFVATARSNGNSVLVQLGHEKNYCSLETRVREIKEEDKDNKQSA